MSFYLYGLLIGNFGFSWWYSLAAFIADIFWLSVVTGHKPVSISYKVKEK